MAEDNNSQSAVQNSLLQFESEQLIKEQKIRTIANHFVKIFQTLGLNLDDPSLAKSPLRIAKMYVDELFKHVDSRTFPKISLFDHPSAEPASEIVSVEKIKVHSICEHHFLPFIGHASIQYIPNQKNF